MFAFLGAFSVPSILPITIVYVTIKEYLFLTLNFDLNDPCVQHFLW